MESDRAPTCATCHMWANKAQREAAIKALPFLAEAR
jgi:hypothetical protein